MFGVVSSLLVSDNNAPLEAGWGIASMARCVELLKYTYPGWDPALEKQFLRFVDHVIMPCFYWEGGAWLNVSERL